jgi:hypothetical protein
MTNSPAGVVTMHGVIWPLRSSPETGLGVVLAVPECFGWHGRPGAARRGSIEA